MEKCGRFVLSTNAIQLEGKSVWNRACVTARQRCLRPTSSSKISLDMSLVRSEHAHASYPGLSLSEWASAGSRTWPARVLGSRLFQGKSRKMFQCVVWGMRRTQNLALRLFFFFCFFASLVVLAVFRFGFLVVLWALETFQSKFWGKWTF